MRRPSSTADTIVAKLSSASTMSATFFVTSVPVMPMPTPMSALFIEGASLTPSPVIAVILPFAFHAVTMRTLCSGCTGLRSVADYAELLRYGDGGVLVVAGYHYRADSRAAAFDYRGLDLGTHGVDHS